MSDAAQEARVPSGASPGDSSPTTVTEMLAHARAGLDRVSAADALEAARDGALLLDIRADSQRERDGVIPGARHIPRNVLEWRCDPSSEWRDAEIAGDLERRMIVFCQEGYQSSLVAAILQRFGFRAATDLIGGFHAWRDAGLPTAPLSPDET